MADNIEYQLNIILDRKGRATLLDNLIPAIGSTPGLRARARKQYRTSPPQSPA